MTPCLDDKQDSHAEGVHFKVRSGASSGMSHFRMEWPGSPSRVFVTAACGDDLLGMEGAQERASSRGHLDAGEVADAEPNPSSPEW
jgi:hypothetical protein